MARGPQLRPRPHRRQQDFLKQAFAKALATASSNPLAANQLINAALNDIKIDKGLDLFGLANRLRKLGSGGVKTWTLPATLGTAANQSVLFLDDAKAQPIIDYFKGTGPEPAEPAATPGNAVPLGRAAVAAQTPSADQTCS